MLMFSTPPLLKPAKHLPVQHAVRKTYVESRSTATVGADGDEAVPAAWARGLTLRTTALPNRAWCDALWYTGALPADVFCMPLTMDQVRAWERILRHGIDPELDEFPRSVLICPSSHG